MGRHAASSALIPVLVTGIQLRRVGAVSDSRKAGEDLEWVPDSKVFPPPKDLGALDACDKHRHEEGEG
jgi:hypothetical protein